MWAGSIDYVKDSSVFKMAWPSELSAAINYADFAEELWLHEICRPLSKKFPISTFPSSSSSLHFSSACYSPICYSTSTSSSSLATLTSTLSIYNFHLQFFLILFSFHPLFFYLLWLPCPPLPLFFSNFSLLLIFLLLNFNFHSFHYSVFQPCLFH